MGVKTRKLGNLDNQIIEWQSVHVSDGSTALTTVAGRGYFIDTTSGAQTVNLPSSPELGDRVSLKDFARTWNTNGVTLASALLDGNAAQTPEFTTQGITVSLIYMGNNQGWSLINEDTTTNLGQQYIAATGGTVTESSDFKIHTFTGDGCFVVSNAGNSGGNDQLEYLVVAGGGAGGSEDSQSVAGGGGGGGGFRFASPSIAPLTYPAKPLAGSTLTAAAQTYPVTVGGGGASSCTTASGSNSVFSTITAAGGGGGGFTGGANPGPRNGVSGGSGGGASHGADTPEGIGGSGNTPSVSPPQGNNGGGMTNPGTYLGGGGGGAIAAGTNGGNQSGPGGDGGGLPTAFGTNGAPCGSYRYYSGGGGGGGSSNRPQTGTAGTGGKGGGAAGGAGQSSAPAAATANSGGGGGGAGNKYPGGSTLTGSAGGKGIVVIRYKFQN